MSEDIEQLMMLKQIGIILPGNNNKVVSSDTLLHQADDVDVHQAQAQAEAEGSANGFSSSVNVVLPLAIPLAMMCSVGGSSGVVKPAIRGSSWVGSSGIQSDGGESSTVSPISKSSNKGVHHQHPQPQPHTHLSSPTTPTKVHPCHGLTCGDSHGSGATGSPCVRAFESDHAVAALTTWGFDDDVVERSEQGRSRTKELSVETKKTTASGSTSGKVISPTCVAMTEDDLCLSTIAPSLYHVLLINQKKK